MHMKYDVTLLTDPRYLYPKEEDPYVDNVLVEDELVTNALVAEGLHVNRVAWDDPDFDWSSTRYALFRAVWDYFNRIDEFTEWYRNTAKSTRFINSKTLIDWNIDKHYLQELEDKEVTIANTLFIEKGTSTDLLDAITQLKDRFKLNSDEYVLKPCIAAGSRHTYKFHLSEWEAYATIFRDLIAREAMMLQEFQKNVVTEGEVSLMLFNGVYTHAILKQAKAGDFRVQDDYGGSVAPYTPEKEAIAFAKQAMNACPETPLYGRADIFKDNLGNWALAELEIFEPELWFRFCPEAAQVMAKQLKETLFS